MAGKGGLWKSLRALLDEFTTFGQPELQRLRREAQALREEIAAVEQTTRLLRQGEERLVLAQLRKALDQKQGAGEAAAQQGQAAQEVVNTLGKHASAIEEAAVQQQAMQRAEQILSKVDLYALVEEGLPLKQTPKQPEAEAPREQGPPQQDRPPDK